MVIIFSLNITFKRTENVLKQFIHIASYCQNIEVYVMYALHTCDFIMRNKEVKIAGKFADMLLQPSRVPYIVKS